MHQGFINPESDIYRLLVSPFRVDDREIYSELLESMRQMQQGAWKGRKSEIWYRVLLDIRLVNILVIMSG